MRMRVIQGKPALTLELQTFARKYSYRKHLDYTLLEELKALRNKIRREKFEVRPEIFHLKLGPGGIRELELFVHALLVIHGGRNPSLQTTSTTEALVQLSLLALLSKEEADELVANYWFLRRLENRIHAFDDQQNYTIDLRHLPPALPQDIVPELQQRCEQVIEIATSLFGALENLASSDEMPDLLDAQKTWLTEKGFARASVDDTWPELLNATALSRRSERDEAARKLFLKTSSRDWRQASLTATSDCRCC